MSTTITASPSFARRLAAWLSLAFVALLLAACGGGADAPPPPEPGAPPALLPPAITQQPADVTVATGQPATFTVVATGSAPLGYQWQRNGQDIAGATAASYALPSAASGDSGAVFHVTVTNTVGSVMSADATLTVANAAPAAVPTIATQPASTSVATGAQASFTVAATCDSGMPTVQWQRNSGAAGAFVDIAGATAVTYTLSTAAGDNGAQFRANVSCGGGSPTSTSVATLGVTAPGGVRLDAFVVNGLRAPARFPGGDAIDLQPDGSHLLITNGARITRLSADLQTLGTVAGVDGNSGDIDGPAASARFVNLEALTHDTAGNVYLAEDSSIRRLGTDGNVTTLAGGPSGGTAIDGTGSAARFYNISGIAMGPDGDLYVADSGNARIRRVTAAGVVTTYAGSGTQGFLDNAAPLSAQFNALDGIAVAANGDVLVADHQNHRIRRVRRSGNGAGAVETLAGSGATGLPQSDGIGAAAVIESPHALALSGNTLTVLQDVGLIRQIDLTTGAVTTLTGSYATPPTGYVDGGPGHAVISDLGGLSLATGGGFMISSSSTIRTVSATGVVKTISARGFSNPTDPGGTEPAQWPFQFATNGNQTLTVDAGGNVVLSADDGMVRRISPAGAISLVAGLPGGNNGMVDGVGSAAQFARPGYGIAAAPDGSLYLSDAESIRKIDPAGNVTLLAGYRIVPNDFSGAPTFGYVDGTGTAARFQNGLFMTVGPDGALYVSDFGNHVIRRVDAAGTVTTVAGVGGVSGFVNGPIATARLDSPASLAFAPDGSLYFTDGTSLRRISADFSSVSLVGGSIGGRLAFDAAGNLFILNGSGLYELPAGATSPNLLIAGGFNDALVLGTAPHLGPTSAMAVVGPKQLVLLSLYGSQLLKVTLP